LLSKILVSDPEKRLNLNDILLHDFFTSSLIPELLPVSTLKTPPPV